MQPADNKVSESAHVTQTEFCYAPGDEGAEFCGDPLKMHCTVLEKTITHEHLVKCMRDDHFVHHTFQDKQTPDKVTESTAAPTYAEIEKELSRLYPYEAML